MPPTVAPTKVNTSPHGKKDPSCIEDRPKWRHKPQPNAPSPTAPTARNKEGKMSPDT